MQKMRISSNLPFSFLFVSVVFLVFSIALLGSSNKAIAAGKFTIDAKINLKKLDNPNKLKVVASANGENQTKYVEGKELNSQTATVSFQFNQKNDIVTAGNRDEYFVCAYDLNAQTDQMKSYSCVEGNLKPNGKNTISIGSGPGVTLSTGSFQTVNGEEIKNPTISVHIPLSDRKDVKDLKVVTMIKGELQSKTIDAQKLLKKSDDNTIIVPFLYNKIPEIGPIRVGDLFFTCVSANELNPPEGTECEHRVTQHTFHTHNIVAR